LAEGKRKSEGEFNLTESAKSTAEELERGHDDCISNVKRKIKDIEPDRFDGQMEEFHTLRGTRN